MQRKMLSQVFVKRHPLGFARGAVQVDKRRAVAAHIHLDLFACDYKLLSFVGFRGSGHF